MIARVAIAIALAACGCAAVPDVTYQLDDGAAPDGDNTCLSNVVPSYASVCCGTIACAGPNCIATCSDCQAQCRLTDLCCPNAQNRAVCHPNATSCP